MFLVTKLASAKYMHCKKKEKQHHTQQQTQSHFFDVVETEPHIAEDQKKRKMLRQGQVTNRLPTEYSRVNRYIAQCFFHESTARTYLQLLLEVMQAVDGCDRDGTENMLWESLVCILEQRSRHVERLSHRFHKDPDVSLAHKEAVVPDLSQRHNDAS